MNGFYNIAKDIAELSTINFDKENILAESNYLGCLYQELATEVSDILAFKHNRMTRSEPDFNKIQKRFINLVNWVKNSQKEDNLWLTKLIRI